MTASEPPPAEPAPLPFADRLDRAVRARAAPVLVGLDPQLERLPAALQAGVQSRAQAAAAVATFCREVIDVVVPWVPAVKPQAAFFEQLGAPGMQALAETIAHARRQGLLVILDGKRNDIGSTAAAYADAYLGPHSAWQADALTVSPYLGDDSLEPFVHAARQRAAGIFVLVKTSNPGSRALQDLVASGRTVYRHVAERVEQWADETRGSFGYGAVGAVVGATYPRQLEELRAAMPHAWLLVPGFGAQGATAADVAAAFDDRGSGAIVNSSRAVIFAYQRPEYAQRFGQRQWTAAVEAATRDMIQQLRAETRAGRLVAGGSGLGAHERNDSPAE